MTPPLPLNLSGRIQDGRLCRECRQGSLFHPSPHWTNIEATGVLDCDVDACAFFLHFFCEGSVGEAGHEEMDHGDVLCAIGFPEVCASGYASLGIADIEGKRGAFKGGEVLGCVKS